MPRWIALLTTLPLALLAPLGGCPSASTPIVAEPPPDPTPPEPPRIEEPPAPPACLDLGEEAYAVAPMIERARLVEGGLYFCRREVDAPVCWVMDLDDGSLTSADVPEDIDAGWTPPPTPAPLKISDDKLGAEVCPESGRCRALELPIRGATILGAAVSASGDYAALTLARDEQYTIQLYALPSGRRLKRITTPSDPYPCASARFVGDTLLVMQDICAGPAGYAWLANPKTARRVAWVGGSAEFGAWSVHEQPVGDDLWAFREDSGRQVVVQSVKDGRIVHRINLDDTFPRTEDGTILADPDAGSMLRNNATGELVLVHDGAAQGKVVRVDPREGRVVKVVTAPRCPR